MRIDILTLFPDTLGDVLSESILGRAQERGYISIEAHQIRDYTTDKHRRTDLRLHGGGMGMLMTCQPIHDCWKAVSEQIGQKPYVIYLSPQGKVLTQWQQTLTNYSGALAAFSNGRTISIHPETAKQYGVAQGEKVVLETPTGSIEGRADVTDTIMPGIVFTPSHFIPSSPFEQTRSEPINSVVPNVWDRISAQFNGGGCRLRKA